MSRLAVAVIEGEELRIRETFGEKVEKKGDKRTEAESEGLKTAGHCATETFGHRDRETQGLSDNDILGPVGIYMQAWQGRHDGLLNPAVAKILENSREPLLEWEIC